MIGLRLASVLACLLLCSWTSMASAQNFIVNGSFDMSVPTNGTGGSWTSSNIGGGGGGWSAAGGNPTGMFTLNENGNSTDPRIEQILSGLTVGQSYTVMGDYQLHVALGNPANSFGVLLDTNVILQLGDPGTTWTPFSTSFIATNTSHVLAIEAERNGSDHSYRIDNISVVAAVPEPTTWVLISVVGLGGGATYWARASRKKNRRWVTFQSPAW